MYKQLKINFSNIWHVMRRKCSVWWEHMEGTSTSNLKRGLRGAIGNLLEELTNRLWHMRDGESDQWREGRESEKHHEHRCLWEDMAVRLNKSLIAEELKKFPRAAAWWKGTGYPGNWEVSLILWVLLQS